MADKKLLQFLCHRLKSQITSTTDFKIMKILLEAKCNFKQIIVISKGHGLTDSLNNNKAPTNAQKYR